MALNVRHLRTSELAATPLEKQFLLEAKEIHRRARRLNHLVQFILHEHHGIKVVALAEMGTRDLLETRRGAVVPPDDTAAFGAAMAQLAADVELRRRLGDEARALASDWSDVTLTMKLAALYRSIASAYRRKPGRIPADPEPRNAHCE